MRCERCRSAPSVGPSRLAAPPPPGTLSLATTLAPMAQWLWMPSMVWSLITPRTIALAQTAMASTTLPSVTSSAAVPNLRHGIILLAPNNRIGTDGNGVGDLAERNIISGNRGAGVSISSSGNVVAGNYIGTDVTGTTAVGNATFNDVFSAGVILHSGNNRVGTNGNGIADAAERNVISGNNFDGVKFNGASDNVVAGNYIGTNAAGTAAIPNARFGVFAGSGTNHRIGTDGNGIADEAERNVISGNTFTGVFVQNSSTVGTIIAGNYIGTDAAGTAALGNNGGISAGDGASNTRIGTDGNGVADAAERNVISG